MGIKGRRVNHYRDTDDYLHVERQKAMVRGDWAAYDEFSKRIDENNAAWAQSKSINEKFDKQGRGNIVVKVLALLGLGAGVGYMAYTEKDKGLSMSGTNGEVKKGIFGTFLSWLK